MKKFHIDNMNRGWFIGDFPSAFNTKDFEVACKKYKAGDYEEKHMHKIATEITLIVKGNALMNGVEHKEGDIIIMEPGEATDFKALTEVTNLVVKIPSITDDKYIVTD
ncbi:hypothetical protein HYW74_02910 [Candidatus Pacearchaeota archaeon]|nr:hypothetical protein [Candidatus Pacearchaeota archaeon]